MNLTVRPAEFVEIEHVLAKAEAFNVDPLRDLADVAVDARAYAVEHDGVIVGGYLLGLSFGVGGIQGIVKAAGGELAGVDLIAHIVPEAEARCRAAGCISMAVYTKRPGLMRKMARMGYGPAGVKLERALNG